MHLLELHQGVVNKEIQSDPKVCQACFGIVSIYLEGKSRKNKSYVTQMVNFLFSDSVSV